MKLLKPIFAFSMILLATSLTYGQAITITMTDVQSWFSVGKSWMYYHISAANTTMDVKTASSTAQSWTLPTVTYSDTSRADNVTPASTPHLSRFPNSTHCQRTIQSTGGLTYTFYQYSRLANDSLVFLGSATRVQGGQPPDTTYFFTQSQTEITFPVTTGYSMTRRDSIAIGSGVYDISTQTETFDAYGTITVGSSPYTALRSKRVDVTVHYSGATVIGRDTSTSFSWVAKEGVLVDVGAANNVQTSGSIPISSITLQTVINTPTSVSLNSSSVPETFELLQNYPNPFNPSTVIQYELASRSSVRLAVYNALGQEVALLVNGEQAAGPHSVVFDAKNLTSGIYFYRLSTNGGVKVGRMSLLK